MDIIDKLEDQLFSESNSLDKNIDSDISHTLEQVKEFVHIDNSLAVLSDLANNISYVWVGAFGRYLGMKEGEHSIIDSIWEEDIYKRIHPDDLFERHLLELEFYNFLKQQPASERLHYATKCKIRAQDDQGDYHYIIHQSSFIRIGDDGALWLALCVYNYCFEEAPSLHIDGMIINKKSGAILPVSCYDNCSNLLSSREIEILVQVQKGLLSKEIASVLHISVNTVNRHRQNIIKKLNVSNSMEAIRVANALGIL